MTVVHNSPYKKANICILANESRLLFQIVLSDIFEKGLLLEMTWKHVYRISSSPNIIQLDIVHGSRCLYRLLHINEMH